MHLTHNKLMFSNSPITYLSNFRRISHTSQGKQRETKNAVFWNMAPCRFKTDVSEERLASIYRVEEITWARKRVFLLPWRWRWHVPPKRRFITNPHSATSQKTVFFIVTTMKTSNPTNKKWVITSNGTVNHFYGHVRQVHSLTLFIHILVHCS
jgi:hypothetical protein